MSIICEKCANLVDCECIPYGTDCNKNFKEKIKKQYCRYCNNLVTGNGTYCTAKNKEMRDSTAKSVNHCKLFEFNEMDAFLKLTDINREVQKEVSQRKQFLNK